MLPEKTLEGQTAIVTGGGTGIGRAIAQEFARLGAKLVLASRSAEHLEPAVSELRSTGAEAMSVPTDVRIPEQVERLCEETTRRFGRRWQCAHRSPRLADPAAAANARA